MLVGQVALLVSFPGLLCVASSSPIPREGGEDQSAAKTEVPFKLYNDNLIIVKATIGPIKNVNMILDTGTSPSAINQEMADRLKVRGKAELLQTLNGTIQAQSVMLPRIQIGPLHADSIRGVVQDLSFLERSLGISLGGIAGLDILSTGSFMIDYRRKRSSLDPSQQVRKQSVLKPKALSYGEGEDRRTRGPLIGRFGDLGDCLSIETGYGHRRNNSMSIRMLQYPPLAERLMSRWLSAEVSLGKDNLGSRNVAIADIDADPQNDFDGLLGSATMGFSKVSFDFENGLFGWE